LYRNKKEMRRFLRTIFPNLINYGEENNPY
jgi:hypothetical protein